MELNQDFISKIIQMHQKSFIENYIFLRTK